MPTVLAISLLSPRDFFYLLKNVEYRLKETYHHLYAGRTRANLYHNRLTYADQDTLRYPLSSLSFSDITKGWYLDALEWEEPFENFVLPLEMSINSLENFSFDEVKTAKNMQIYWGMPIFSDRANRNPLFYVLQLSEDYRFFRLCKSKFLYKWLFF
jgi:hypothetical protein